jgi:uncharacterized SAM-binding protein YcdF (DUF218 family)
MFQYVAKLAWLLLEPSNALTLAAITGFLLTAFGFRRSGLTLSGLAVVALAGIGFAPVGNLLLIPLEERFPQPLLENARVDGIVVLGGAVNSRLSVARDQLVMGDSAERYLMFSALARRFPEARIVLSGGAGFLSGTDAAESAQVKRFAADLSLPADRLIVEDTSVDTWTNALRTAELVQPKPGERWLLVTSAFHMPRAMGCFRQAGFDPVAVPTDYWTAGPADRTRLSQTASAGLTRADIAVKEWIGLTAYWLAGRQKGWFPTP